MLNLDISSLHEWLGELKSVDLQALESQVAAQDGCGWLRLPTEFGSADFARLSEAGARISSQAEVLVVVGAGGSSLGARALVRALPERDGVSEVLFTGDNLSGAAMSRLLKSLAGREFSVIVASKSGTTTESTIALRFMLRLLRERYGELMRERLYVVVGAHSSALRTFAGELGCTIFDIPEDVGGRYSVLTATGLLPAAARGLDIAAIVAGARAELAYGAARAAEYASARQALAALGFRTEIFATYEPDLAQMGDWWRQLFGESEGKDGGGIFPTTVCYSGDLHSMGQYIQDGRRDIFELMVTFETQPDDAIVPENAEFDDGLGLVDLRSLNSVNSAAAKAVRAAHIAGGVPVMSLSAGVLDEAALGALMFFFERACAFSATIAGVNPFDQPGVEVYKRELRELLGRGE